MTMQRALPALTGLVLVLAGSVTLANARPVGEVRAGEAIYARCAACHALSYDRTGPRHCGLIGRRIGSVEGFAYSDAMKQSNIVWNDKTLNLFLADPVKTVPGTTMGYAGVKDSQERADLIAYLKQAGNSAECRKYSQSTIK